MLIRSYCTLSSTTKAAVNAQTILYPFIFSQPNTSRNDVEWSSMTCCALVTKSTSLKAENRVQAMTKASTLVAAVYGWSSLPSTYNV